MFWRKNLQNVINDDNFEINISNKRKLEKFNAEQIDYRVKFKNIPTEFIESTQYMLKIMHLLVKKLIVNTKPRDLVKIYINHPVLTTPISLKFVKITDLTPEMILNEISKVVQSNKILTLDNKITFHTVIMHYLTGGGGGVKRLENFLFKKQSMVRVKPNKDDSLCALRAIIVGKAFADKDPEYDTIRKLGSSFQSRRALEIAIKLGFPLDEQLGMQEIKKVERHA